MDLTDFDIDQNEFDNFNNMRKRPRRRRRDMRMPSEDRDIRVSSISEKSNSLENARKRKRKKHKAVLDTLKSQGFFHNRHNHKGIYNQVRKMAQEIDDLSKKLIVEKAKPNCKCGSGQRQMKYRNFEGGGVKNIWEKYKTPILLGGAIYFFFFSELGKKMIKK